MEFCQSEKVGTLSKSLWQIYVNAVHVYYSVEISISSSIFNSWQLNIYVKCLVICARCIVNFHNLETKQTEDFFSWCQNSFTKHYTSVNISVIYQSIVRNL